MTKAKIFWKKFIHDYRHWICVALTLGFLALAIFYFEHAFARIIESLVDVGQSAKFYVSELFELNLQGNLGVIEFTKLPFEIPFNIPATWEDFTNLWGMYWNRFISRENLAVYMEMLGNALYYLSKLLIIFVPVIMVIVAITQLKYVENNDYNQDTKSLSQWRSTIERGAFKPVKTWIKGFIEFLKENSFYAWMWLVIWLYSFNGIAIILETLAFYLYFVATFRFADIYVQFVKLFMDLSVCIAFIPDVGWILIGYTLMDKLRRYIGYNRLEHMEYKNRGFINERPIVVMINGTMGKGKTTMITDMALSQEIMFRDKAFEMMMKADLKFPNFPWINLELSLKRAIRTHTVYNLATVRKFIRRRRRAFEKQMRSKYIFDYDFELYGLEYDNKLYIENVWDVIETYAQLYLIYVTQSSLIISNYSIRSDIQMIDKGNLPVWNTELFRVPTEHVELYSQYAHILDFDMLRLGKKVAERNRKADTFEFGVIVITEIGKERGNNLENQELKKKDETANAKNDLFNDWLKMIRHNATVDNFPFVKVIVDEQRPESWGADARDLCEIGIIEERSEKKLAMPLFALADLLISWKLGKGCKAYTEHRFNRGDNTLKTHLSHGLDSLLFKFHNGIYNTFGYDKVCLNIEKGTRDGETSQHWYYLIDSKVRRKRFSTDCFSEVFEEKTLRSDIGLDDLECYVTDKAQFWEMLESHSYFFNKLANIRNGA